MGVGTGVDVGVKVGGTGVKVAVGGTGVLVSVGVEGIGVGACSAEVQAANSNKTSESTISFFIFFSFFAKQKKLDNKSGHWCYIDHPTNKGNYAIYK